MPAKSRSNGWYTADGKPNLPKIGREATKKWWAELFEKAKETEEPDKWAVKIERWLCRNDLFYLLTVVCKRKDIDRNWIFDRSREVQLAPNGYLDLWSREHYKSSVITFGLSIQDILASHGEDPEARYNGREATIGIFSATQKLAADFLDQIKQEFEKNDHLKTFFPDVLYEKPDRQSPSWSKINGITVKRITNPRECTVEAWGLVDNMPTGKHFFIRVYDDIVVPESITETQLPRTNKAWELSLNLGASGGWVRYIGTKYAMYDTYHLLLERGAAIPRIYPCVTETVEKGGIKEPVPETAVLMTPEEIKRKRREMGPYVFGAQMLLDPSADRLQGFRDEWLQYWEPSNTRNLSFVIVCDPANEKKKDSDYTVFWVVGLGPDENWYVVDMIRDKMNLAERCRTAVKLHRQWKPKRFGWEEYGLTCDVQALEAHMEVINYRFSVISLGGQMSKMDRIRRLIPLFENGNIYLPRSIVRRNYEDHAVDVIRQFVDEEFRQFPTCITKDMLDALARITDDAMHIPTPPLSGSVSNDASWRDKLRGGRNPYGSGSWMTM